VEKLLAPIVLFVYNREEHTRKTIEALAQNELATSCELHIFSDSNKNELDFKQIIQVRGYIDSIKRKNYFKSVIIYKSEKNMGLANSIIKGVTRIINEYGKIIVLEDDLVSRPDFLKYMNTALDFFETNEKIWAITGFAFPMKFPKKYDKDIYLSYRACSWSWGTWKNRWNTVDWDVKDYKIFQKSNKLRKKFNRGGLDLAKMLDKQMKKKNFNSWAIRWCYSQNIQDLYTVYPRISRIKNIGFDGSGIHHDVSSKFDVSFETNISECKFENLDLDRKVARKFKNIFGTRLPYFVSFFYKRIVKLIKKIKNKIKQKKQKKEMKMLL